MRATQEETRIAILSLVTIFFMTSQLDAVVINVPTDQPTIQAGIDAAISGMDEVVVAPGTYSEIINFSGKAITVRSSGGATATTIDATGVPDPGDGVPVVRMDSGEGLDSVLEGFTITGGTGDTAISEGPQVGGGVFISQSSATLRGCVIEGNAVTSLGGGILVNEGELVLKDCTVQTNHADISGGAMYMNATTGLSIDGCTFADNTSSFNKAGIEFNAATGAVVITGSLFEGHISGGDFGSAIAASGHGGPVTIDQCVFRDNAQSGGLGGAVFLNEVGINRITNSLFVGNSSGFSGGAINFEGLPGSFIAGCVFVNNSTGNRGGAVFHRAAAPIFNCSFSGNTASNGSAVDFSSLGNALFANCVFWDETGANPIRDGGFGTLTVNNSIVEGGWTGLGSGNLDADPLFVDPVNEDLSLMAGSPAIDSGDTPAVASVLDLADFVGAARLANDPMTTDTGVPVFGQTIDMGAYEFGSTPPSLIEQQPESLIGMPFAVSIFIVNAPDATSFQWFFNGVPLTDSGPYSGTTTSVLVIATGTQATEGLYAVEVSDGVRTETSVDAALVVLSDTTGACCLPLGDCGVFSEADCLAIGGTYSGDGTDCSGVNCQVACLGDMNEDGAIDGTDAQMFVAALLSGAMCN